MCVNIGLDVCSGVCLWQGTNVASGKARGVVIGTGQNTEIGRVEQTTFTSRKNYYQN